MAHLTLEQRYKIEAYKTVGKSLSAISDYVGKDKSVISREIKRNSDGRSGLYKAALAEKKAKNRQAEKPKNIRLDHDTIAVIETLLIQGYSPEQIEGRRKSQGLFMVSKETIYKYIYDQKRKGGKLYKLLRTKGKKYKKRGNKNDKRGLIADRVDISKRPKIVEQKSRIGDLEIDLVIGANHKGALLTINDRATGMLFMDKIASKEAHLVQDKTIEILKDWKPFIHTITSDNGKEFANHKAIAKGLDIDYYFAKPYHSWERGANENLNGLIRQYFPKKSNFENITEQEIKTVINSLNNRPRKRFGYKTPNEIYAQKLDENSRVAFMT